MQLEIMQERTEPQAHEEICMQIELESGKDAFFRARPAANPPVAFQYRNAHPRAGKVSCKRQAVMTGSDHDAVEFRHTHPARLATTIATQPNARRRAEQSRRNCPACEFTL